MVSSQLSLVLIAIGLAANARAAEGPVAGAPGGTDAAARESARQHYGRGLEQAQGGRYEQALSEFLAAYRDQPHYAALYNIGLAYIELGRPVEAITALERYLQDGKDGVSRERAEQVRAQIAVQKALTAELIVSVEAPDARISVDGVPVGGAPRVGPLRLVSGPHDVALSRAGAPGLHRSVVLVAGQTLELAFPDAPPPASKRAPLAHGTEALGIERDPAALPEVDDRADATTQTLGYVLGSVGLALGGVALGHYVYNRERYDRWQSENTALERDTTGSEEHRERQLDNNALAASIERASHWTVALSVAGGAFFACGATVLIVHASAPVPGAGESATSLTIEGVW
jgi:tetratricopeptide repeat protein